SPPESSRCVIANEHVVPTGIVVRPLTLETVIVIISASPLATIGSGPSCGPEPSAARSWACRSSIIAAARSSRCFEKKKYPAPPPQQQTRVSPSPPRPRIHIMLFELLPWLCIELSLSPRGEGDTLRTVCRPR